MAVVGPPQAAVAVDAAVVQRDRLETLGRLTAGIAHELNNPIGYIACNINTLERAITTLTGLVDAATVAIPAAERPAWEERLAAARWNHLRGDLPALIAETRQGADQLKHVVAELKSLCRQSAQPEPVSVDQCVHAALTVLTHALKRRTAVCLDLAAPGQLPLVRAQVLQLVINLVSNAVEAFAERPRSANAIHIATSGDADSTVLTCDDNGPGVSVAEREQIFQPFHTSKRDGVGLGLAIVRRIAAQHGGMVTCDQSPTLGGARFTVTLRTWAPESV